MPFDGTIQHFDHAAYRACIVGEYSAVHIARQVTTTRPNVDALNRRVASHIAISKLKAPAEAEAYLTKVADHIAAQALREDDHPALRGVSAFDIASAVERLHAAVAK